MNTRVRLAILITYPFLALLMIALSYFFGRFIFQMGDEFIFFLAFSSLIAITVSLLIVIRQNWKK